MKFAQMGLIVTLMMAGSSASFANDETGKVSSENFQKQNTNRPGSVNENGNYHHTGSGPKQEQSATTTNTTDSERRDIQRTDRTRADAARTDTSDRSGSYSSETVTETESTISADPRSDEVYARQEQQVENGFPWLAALAVAAVAGGIYYVMKNRRRDQPTV